MIKKISRKEIEELIKLKYNIKEVKYFRDHGIEGYREDGCIDYEFIEGEEINIKDGKLDYKENFCLNHYEGCNCEDYFKKSIVKMKENLIICGKCKRDNDFRERTETPYTYDVIKCRGCENIIYC